jgi:hypothetical protein
MARPRNEGLSRRDSRWCSGKDFMGLRGALAEMRLVGEQVAVECSLSAGRIVMGALTKDVVGITTRHTTGEATRVSALEIGGGVNREAFGFLSRGGLVSLHRLFSRGEEGASKGGDIVGGCARDRGDGRKRNRRLRESNRERGGKGSVFQFAIDGLGN